MMIKSRLQTPFDHLLLPRGQAFDLPPNAAVVLFQETRGGNQKCGISFTNIVIKGGHGLGIHLGEAVIDVRQVRQLEFYSMCHRKVTHPPVIFKEGMKSRKLFHPLKHRSV